jgi:hypothetical protein
MSDDYHKIGKKITSSNETDYHTHVEIEATFDDGSKEKYIEHRQILSASRRPRWVDYVVNHQINTTITDDEDTNS